MRFGGHLMRTTGAVLYRGRFVQGDYDFTRMEHGALYSVHAAYSTLSALHSLRLTRPNIPTRRVNTGDGSLRGRTGHYAGSLSLR